MGPVARLGLALAVLAGLWVLAGVALLEQTQARHEMRLADAIAATRALLGETQQALLREARFLASDPAVVEGVVKGDWATLARGASPRILSVTSDRIGDLLVITDASGAPLVQVPALPRLKTVEVAPPPVATTLVRAIGGQLYVLAAAPISRAGVAIVGRRFERLEQIAASVPSHPVVVAVAGDRLLATTRGDFPATGWVSALLRGALQVNGEDWITRPLSEREGLWTLVSSGDFHAERRRLLSWLVGSWAVAALVVVGVGLMSSRAQAWGRAHSRIGQEWARDREAFHAITRAMDGASDLSTGLGGALEAVRGLMGVTAAVVYRLEARGGRLALVAQRGVPDERLEAFSSRPVDGTDLGDALRSGRIITIRVEDSAFGYRTQIVVPVHMREAPWGVLLLLSTDDRALAVDADRRLETVSLLFDAALAQAALRTETDQKSRQLESLTRLAQTLTGTLALEEVLQRVVDAGVWIFHSSIARLWLVEDDGKHLVLRASAGAPSTVVGVTRLALGDGLVGTVAATRRPQTILDAQNDPRIRNVERLRAEGSASVAGVPVMIGERVLGVLSTAVRERHDYGVEELELLQSLANHAAIAIDNARLFLEEKARRDQVTALLDINKKIGAEEPTDALLGAIAEEAARLLDVDNAGFRLVEGDMLVLAGLAGTAEETMVRPRVKIGESFSGKVVAEGRTLMVEAGTISDMVPEHRERERQLGYTHYLGVPLRVGDRVIGVLAFRARRRFSPRDQELAEAFAGQASIALEHARLYREANRHAQRMAALADVERLLSATLDSDVVAQRIADSVCTLLEARAAAVYRLLPETGDVEAMAVSGDVGARFNRIVFARGTGASGLAIRDRRPVVTPDILNDPRIELRDDARARIEAAGYRAVLTVPLIVHDRVIGALGIGDRAGRAFDEADIRLTQAFADQAALALENARLFSLETARRAHIETLAAVERELAAELDLDRLLALIVEHAGRLFGAEGAIYLVEPAGHTLAPSAWSEGASIDQRVAFGVGLVGSCALERQGRLVNDYAASPYAQPQLVGIGTRHAIVQPLVIRDRLLGVIGMFRFGESAHAFSEEELGALGHFATQAAIALENARLYEETEQGRREAEELGRVARTFTERLEVSAVGERIVDSVLTLFRVRSAGLRLLQPDGSLVAVAWGGHGAHPPGHVQAPGTGLAARAIETGGPVWSHEVLSDSDVVYDDDLRGRIDSGTHGSVLAVPLHSKDRTIGVLFLSDTAAHEFSEREVHLAQAFADQAALALDNARLHEDAEGGRRYAEELARLARSLTETLDSREVCTRIVERVPELFRVAASTLRLLRPDGGLEAAAYGGTRWEQLTPGDVLPAGIGVAGRAVAEGRAVWSTNLLEDADVPLTDELRQRLRGAGIRALLSAPLKVKGKILGTLTLADPAARGFSSTDAERLQALADQAALALDNARLHEEAEQRRREAEVLAVLARTINESLDVDTVLQRVAEGARELSASDMARVALRDPQLGRFAFRYWVGTRYEDYGGFPLTADRGIAGRVITTGRPFRTENWLEDPRIRKPRDLVAVVLTEGIVTELMVPITIGDRVEGLISVNNRTARVFTDRDETVLQRLADHAAIAIQNARLYSQSREFGDRLRALEEVNRLVSSSLQIEEVLRNLATAVARFFDAPLLNVWVVDPTTRRLHRSLSLAPADLAAGLPRTLEPGEGGVGWVAEHREPIMWTDMATDARCVARQLLISSDLRYLLAYPITIGDRVLGVFAMNRTLPGIVTPESQLILASLASQAAVALDHARLYTETTRRLAETRALLDVAEIFTSTLDATQLLKRVTIKIAQVCGVDRCSIERWDGDRVIPVMSQFADGHEDAAMWEAFKKALIRSPRAVPAHAQARATRRPVVIDDVTESDQIPREWVTMFRHKSYMVVPLCRQDDVLGGLALDYTERVTPFQPWQVTLASAIAGQLALSLENTRLYGEVQEQLSETTTLLSVGHVLSESLPVAERLRRVIRETARALGADMAGAYIADERGERLVPIAGYHIPLDLRDALGAASISLERVPALVEAWRAGELIASVDVHADARFNSEWTSRLPTHAMLLAPLRIRGVSMGALGLGWRSGGREFSPREIRLLEGVARQVGLALDNAELTRQREIKLRETETLLSVSRTLSSTLDLNALLRQFLRQAVVALGADSVGIYLLDDDGEFLVARAGYRVPPGVLPGMRALRLSTIKHAFYAEAARTRRPQFSRDVRADLRIPDVLRETMPHRSQLFVPILAKDRLIGGFIAVWFEAERDLSVEELSLMEAVANQAGSAVENARLFEQNRRQVEELSVLHELARAMAGQLDREALLETLRVHVPPLLSARKLVVVLADEQRGDVEVVLRVVDGAVDDHATRYERSVGLTSVVMETGRPFRTDDYAAVCARRNLTLPPVHGPRCWLGAPLTVGQVALGVLAVSRDEPPFSDGDERLVANVGDLAALALRSAGLYEDLTRAYGELGATQDHLVRTEKLRALGEMASGVAHDFNNLLAAILGRAQLALRKITDPQLRQWVQIIERSALDGAQTVRRLQDFARVRQDQPLVPVDLNAVVRDALEMTQSRWRDESLRRGVVIDVRTSLGTVPRVTGDPAELREAMTNLILNAVDAMPAGGTLSLATAAVADGVELSVSDTGVGMPASVRDRIFDPFFTTKGPQGTGLGLSMTYGIVSRHRARIVVETAEGRGSTFRMTFPAGSVTVEEPPAPAEAAPEAGTLRCLVVDDEEAVGSVIGDVLEAVGHRAVVVTSGAAAIERFRAEPFDAVFTDLAMPGVSGWQVAQAVKSTTPAVPVFVVTGFGVELSREERGAHDVDAVYAKPLKIEDVMDAVARVARRRASRQ
ncbi:MAG: hypothetical protein DMD89_23545 [Candidatus Rokuibacteriota bacterium]|nr:MAG: hypothetical protein DMD89_23545 [Candidatus Rokubacteria bacterium]